MMENNEQPKPKSELREVIMTAFRTAVFTLLFIYFVAQPSLVQGRSMEPNLHTDQRIIIEKVSYHFDLPERGDIVVLESPESDVPLIKRVVGLPGEEIEIRRNQLYIDGELYDEPYLETIRQQKLNPIIVPEGQIYVMGDNRLVSRDSRAFGPVDVADVVGKAWVSYWPVEDIGLFNVSEMMP